MSESALDDRLEEEIQGEGRPGEDGELERPRRLKRPLLFLALALGLALSGGGAGAYFTGSLDRLLGKGPGQGEPVTTSNVIFYELPELLVNLTPKGTQTSFLKIRVSLELDEGADVAAIGRLLPRIIDNFQVYLRELRADDLHGSAGVYRLKEELLVRVRVAVHPVEVRDVLFKEILVQ